MTEGFLAYIQPLSSPGAPGVPTSSSSNQNVYIVGTGLAWNFNRYLALSGDVSYELTTQKNTADTGVTRAGLGLVLRR